MKKSTPAARGTVKLSSNLQGKDSIAAQQMLTPRQTLPIHSDENRSPGEEGNVQAISANAPKVAKTINLIDPEIDFR